MRTFQITPLDTSPIAHAMFKAGVWETYSYVLLDSHLTLFVEQYDDEDEGVYFRTPPGLYFALANWEANGEWDFEGELLFEVVCPNSINR